MSESCHINICENIFFFPRSLNSLLSSSITIELIDHYWGIVYERCVTQFMHKCDMTHSYVRHDSLTCVTWLIHMSASYHINICENICFCFLSLNRLMTRQSVSVHRIWVLCDMIHMCDMTHWYFWHDLFTRDSYVWVTCRIYVSHLTHICEWHDSHMWVVWLIHVRDMTHIREWHDLTQNTSRAWERVLFRRDLKKENLKSQHYSRIIS